MLPLHWFTRVGKMVLLQSNKIWTFNLYLGVHVVIFVFVLIVLVVVFLVFFSVVVYLIFAGILQVEHTKAKWYWFMIGGLCTIFRKIIDFFVEYITCLAYKSDPCTTFRTIMYIFSFLSAWIYYMFSIQKRSVYNIHI